MSRIVRFGVALGLACVLPQGSRAASTIGVPDVLGLSRVADADAALPIHLAFDLALREPDALARLVVEQATPGAPAYRRFLSNGEWHVRFAPSPEAVGRVLTTLRSLGFAVDAVADNAGVIDATAPASTVERVFATRLEMVAQPGAGMRMRNAIPAHIPPELARDVGAVAGLSTLRLIHAVPAGRAEAPAGPQNGPDGGYGPGVLSQGFDYPARHGYDGTGRIAGILIPGDFQDSDLAAYLGYFRVTHTGQITRVPVDGGNAVNNDVETTLDVETVAALAPGAAIVIYEFPDFVAKDVNDALNQIVSDNRVDSFSASWGACEKIAASMGLWDPAQLHQFFLQATAKGITPIFATGDTGDVATGCDFGSRTVSSPAADPEVVAVGGTLFTEFQGGKLRGQAGWSGSGGGVSKQFRQPAYQHGVAGVMGTGRNLPDVALPGAVEDSYYNLGQTGGWQTVGGTSWAAPAFNALLVEAAQLHGGRFGLVNPALYAASGKSAGFTDIVGGSNGDGDAGYKAVAGYDLVTGLGVPNGWALAMILAQ